MIYTTPWMNFKITIQSNGRQNNNKKKYMLYDSINIKLQKISISEAIMTKARKLLLRSAGRSRRKGPQKSTKELWGM